MTVTAGVLIMAIGLVVQLRGIGPDWLSWRIAQVCILAGLAAVLEPVSGDLRGYWHDGLQYIADAFAQAIHTAAYTNAILTVPARVLCLAAFVSWLGALLTPKGARWFGRWVTISHNQVIVWGYGLAMVVFGRLAGGNLADAITAVTDGAQNLGAGISNFVFGG